MPTLFDNSVLVESRALQNSSVCAEKIQFIEDAFKQLGIKAERALITDKLFIEIIGLGKIRENIEDENAGFFKEWKENIVRTLIGRDKACIKDVIDRYILALEHLFLVEFQAKLSQENTYSIAIDNTSKYEFISFFSPLKSKLLSYAQNLREKGTPYKTFIGTLVEDSVIRYLFDSIDIRQTKPKLYDNVFDFLNQCLRALIVKYRSAGVLGTNINLLMSVLKDNIEAQLKPGQKSQPLFRVYNDFADPELGYFPIYGKMENGLHVPVTVVTKEPRPRVEERLKYNFQAVGVKADVVEPQHLMTGRTVILDFENRIYHEIVTKDYIQSHFKFASGGSIF